MINNSEKKSSYQQGDSPYGVTTDETRYFTRNINLLHNMHILIADHSKACRDLTAKILCENGFTRFTAVGDREHARTLLRESLKHGVSDIDLVLVDIRMPGMGGYEFCRMLRAQQEWCHIPIVILAAPTDTLYSSLELDATDVVFKPLNDNDLIPRVISMLSFKRERDLRMRREQELENELAERKIMEARLQYLVEHDDLTGLCNRRRLDKALEEAVENSRNHSVTNALLYIDIDQFKVVNDTEGHSVGDKLLIKIANKIRRLVSSTDTLARVGSDEYCVLLEETSCKKTLKMAKSLRKLMNNFQFNIENRSYHIGASIGVALILPEEKNVSASEILARADQACLEAKNHGRNMVHFYNEEDTEISTLRNNAHWAPLIRQALAEERFSLVFQPVLDVQKNEVTHYETLIRMIGSDGQQVSPTDFIPVAERMGLIHDINQWVITHAIEALSNLPTEQQHLSLNVNLSSHAFQGPSLLPIVKEKIDSTGVRPERITFEITETAAIKNFAQTRKMIIELRALGCRFALDDFGTGFNSFSYLKQLPVDYLKIDGAFITNLINDPVDQTLVRSMIEIAKTLGKQTVAEFVENEQVLQMLKEYGVDYVQGYHIGMPKPDLAT
ncbi:MAG: EAL domain-containing protein [Gammaproteobacteria bacterium]|nr:EAL domain-containing protein [Gammaproteobacteria bacterium]